MTLTPSMRSTLTREPAGMAGRLLGAGGPGGAVHGDLALGLQVVDVLRHDPLPPDDPVCIGGYPGGVDVLSGQRPHGQQAQERDHQEQRDLKPDVGDEEGQNERTQRAHTEPN